MFPKIFEIGNFFLPTYGVLVAAAFLTALWVAGRLARLAGLDADAVTNLGVYCAIAGLLGAKVLLIVFDWQYYAQNPGEIFTLSTLRAGGVFHGGLIAALAVGFYYMRRKKLPVLRTLDVFAPGLALGHAIGRLGCFAAGCCWGVACDRSWAVTFTNTDAHQLTNVPLNQPLHPTQLYEAGAEGVIFAVLFGLFHRQHREGQIIGLYLVLYALARFLVDFVRAYSQANPFGGPLTTTQWIALGLLGLGGWLSLRRPRSTTSRV